MAVVLYQRSEPRQKEWLPLLSQQIRLRNIKQIMLVNTPVELVGELGYFTLHVSPMSAPFYTSLKIKMEKVTIWPEIQVALCSARLSTTGCIIRVWTGGGILVVSWGVWFKGLHYLGHKDDWNNAEEDFEEKMLVFVTPFGSFTSYNSVKRPPVEPQRFLQVKVVPESPVRASYVLHRLKVLHSLQRSVLEEHADAERLVMEMGIRGLGVGSPTDHKQQPVLMSERLTKRAQLGKQKLRLREEIELVSTRVKCLNEEKGRAQGRLRRVNKDASTYDEMSTELVTRMHNFATEKLNLRDIKASLISNGHALADFRASVFVRRKQLISELLQIYPLELIEISRKYSINGVQLPNAEDYGSETGGQISVALGYSAHFSAMLAFFLDIPCRYPVRHFGSRSRIIDHITVQIPDREREFPLYYKGKRDVYCAYAIYLLNKNIAQLRWYCGLSTPDLRATLPNLVELLSSRLTIPGWPPNIGEALEIAQEITEDIDSQFLENDITLSLDKGLDKLKADALSDNGTGEPVLPDDGFSDENPGNNSAALGDVKHGRGQEKFLSGWKKKTYDTDDFDPKWLMDSMNLDFDSGRRLSLSNSSPPPKPIFVISDDGSGPRKRRLGQVEPPPLRNLEEGKLLPPEATPPPPTDLRRNYTPSREIARLEGDIKEFERRKSRSTATTLGVPLSTEGANTKPITPSPPPPSMPNYWATDDEQRMDVVDKVQPDNNLAPDTMSTVHVEHSEACNPAYHIPPPVDLMRDDQDDRKSSEESGTSENVTQTKEFAPTVATDTNVEGNTVCDNLTPTPPSKEPESKNNEENPEDALLWMRTEALLGSSQSFNLVRQRMPSESS